MAYIIQSNILPNPFSYERIMVRKTNHSYKVIQICRDNNLSHFCQITFFNSLQAPKKEQALFQSLRLRSFLLFRRLYNKKRTLVLNPSYIHRELSSLFINRYIPGPHIPFSVHFSRWRINTCIIIDLSSMIPLISASS